MLRLERFVARPLVSVLRALGGLLVQGNEVLLHLGEGHHDAVDSIAGSRAIELRANGVPMTLGLGDGLDAGVATEEDTAVAPTTGLDGGVDRDDERRVGPIVGGVDEHPTDVEEGAGSADRRIQEKALGVRELGILKELVHATRRLGREVALQMVVGEGGVGYPEGSLEESDRRRQARLPAPGLGASSVVARWRALLEGGSGRGGRRAAEPRRGCQRGRRRLDRIEVKLQRHKLLVNTRRDGCRERLAKRVRPRRWRAGVGRAPGHAGGLRG